jgi:hypothetical protein
VKTPHTAPLPIVGWACFEYVGYEYLAAWDDRGIKRYPVVVARYVIACGRGPRWSEIEAARLIDIND